MGLQHAPAAAKATVHYRVSRGGRATGSIRVSNLNRHGRPGGASVLVNVIQTTASLALKQSKSQRFKQTNKAFKLSSQLNDDASWSSCHVLSKYPASAIPPNPSDSTEPRITMISGHRFEKGGRTMGGMVGALKRNALKSPVWSVP